MVGRDSLLPLALVLCPCSKKSLGAVGAVFHPLRFTYGIHDGHASRRFAWISLGAASILCKDKRHDHNHPVTNFSRHTLRRLTAQTASSGNTFRLVGNRKEGLRVEVLELFAALVFRVTLEVAKKPCRFIRSLKCAIVL